MIESENIVKVRLEEIKEKIVAHSINLTEWEIRKALHLAPEKYEYKTGWYSIKTGEVWGKPGETVFLRRRATVPAEWKDFKVGLQMNTGGEGLLTVNDSAYHGVDDNRGYILLTARAAGGEQYDLEAEMKVGGYWNWENEKNDPGEQSYLFQKAQLIAIDSAAEEAYFDFNTIYLCALAVRDKLLKEALLRAARNALYTIDFRNNFIEKLKKASVILWKEVEQIHFADTPAEIFFTGHSHIDVAWLWPLRETARKCGRTYSTVTSLMDEFPNYYFNCSQPPLFKYTKKYFPEVYKKIKERVSEGRFEPVGGTWVEHDSNLVCGESLVRQCLYGQRFFKKEFGGYVRVGWLPDVFGYTWSLPQIYKKAGIECFMTSKMSWNDTNTFPHGTFMWEGIDGTQILTHFVCGTYNAMVKPDEMLKHWEDYPSKIENPEFLSCFGFGDGGGGPTREMLEAIPRLKKIPGIPKARTGRVHEFFKQISQKKGDLPVWNGELYLEKHRGTYTTQAKNKKANRKSELLFRDTEFLSSIAFIQASSSYPADNLREGWKIILLNQFHDIIPGSSIPEVYRESLLQYEKIQQAAIVERDKALRAITGKLGLKGDGIPVVVFNTLSWKRTDIVSVDLQKYSSDLCVIDSDGHEVAFTVSDKKLIFLAENVPSMGFKTFYIPNKLHKQAKETKPFSIKDLQVETNFYLAELNNDGSFKKLYDKRYERDILPEGNSANILQFFEDKPACPDAWDIESHYREKVWNAEVKVPLKIIKINSIRLVAQVDLLYGDSLIRQEITFYSHTPRIDISHSVDWKERKILLKAAFPLNIRSSKAAYEIPYGAIERPTHSNTSWDWAQFEVPGQRWADLSEADYGVSILNDCKYGWDIQGNVFRITLLRSTNYPDPAADLGQHEYTYALYPHSGSWRNGSVQEAYSFNSPLLAIAGDPNSGGTLCQDSFITVDRDNIIVDAVKKAEDSDDIIIRIYEAYGARCPVTLTFNRTIFSASECDLLEEDIEHLSAEKNILKVYMNPFEIKTLKIAFKK